MSAAAEGCAPPPVELLESYSTEQLETELRSRGLDCREAIAKATAAFGAFEAAIGGAHRMFPDCQQWTNEEREPIDAARTAFYNAIEGVSPKEER